MARIKKKNIVAGKTNVQRIEWLVIIIILGSYPFCCFFQQSELTE